MIVVCEEADERMFWSKKKLSIVDKLKVSFCPHCLKQIARFHKLIFHLKTSLQRRLLLADIWLRFDWDLAKIESGERTVHAK